MAINIKDNNSVDIVPTDSKSSDIYKKKFSITKIMSLVILALLFPICASIYFFGIDALKVIATAVVTSVATEYLVKLIKKQPFIMDGSAVVTGILLALTLPPLVPLWMVVIGAVFSIAVAKESFGGLGLNIFNPALAGRAFMQLAFVEEMSTWITPPGFSPDVITSASPLTDSFKQIGSNVDLYWDLFIGNISGSLGETSALVLLVGGILLIILKIIDWRIPLIYIGTVALLSVALGQDAVFQILSGGLILGAFFMATDYVTTPITKNGKIVFAVGCGVLTIIIRFYGGMPEGVCYAILLMNSTTPLIDRYVKPKLLIKGIA
jgi:electron transport complex protein RnfD